MERKQKIVLTFVLKDYQEDIDVNLIMRAIEELDFWSVDAEGIEIYK